MFGPVPQYQAQVQRSNGPRLAGAGTGFNEATAPEVETVRFENQTCLRIGGHCGVGL